jgi:hypothetical protein
MLHVRVVSPAALTDQLTVRLAAAPGVQNMVVRDGAANPDFAARRELASAGVSAPSHRRGRPQYPARDHLQRVMTRPLCPPRMAW